MYKHQPLDLTKRQRRLILLHSPAQHENAETSPVHCEIATFDVNEADYTALSYVWGSPTVTQTIYINKEPFPVRQNLFDFLKTFRNDPANCLPKPTYLWIDQLCIDQKNDSERNQQVQLMSEIYRQCQYALVWLHGSWKDAAIEFNNERSHICARRLWEHEYFTRLWIVQELVLPARVEILCEGCWVSWFPLRHAYHMWTLKWSPIGSYENRDLWKPGVWLSHPCTSHTSQSGGDSLDSAFEKFRTMESQLRHDKIYGLLGLVKPKQRPVVDYNKPLIQVFVDVVWIVLRANRVRDYVNFNTYDFYWRLAEQLQVNFTVGFFRFEDSIRKITEEAKKGCSDSKLLPPYPIQEIGFKAVDGKESLIGEWWFVYQGQRNFFPANKNEPCPASFEVD